VKGHLHLTSAAYANGLTYLREQSFRAPMHLSKPHHDEGSLVVNIVNPTAGIFDDDVISLAVTAEMRSSIVLTTPSAGRVYRSRKGGTARMTQKYRVESGAHLEFYPEPFIPQAGSRYEQKSTLKVAAGGTLIFFEWLTPGRVASGESFKYTELLWDTDVSYAGKLVSRERYHLSPDDDSLNSMRLAFDGAHYVSCYFMADVAFPRDEVEALNADGVYLGWTPLVKGGWTIKALCAGALEARRTLKALRPILYAALGKSPASLGRY